MCAAVLLHGALQLELPCLKFAGGREHKREIRPDKWKEFLHLPKFIMFWTKLFPLQMTEDILRCE